MFSLSCLPFHEDLSGGTGCSAGRAHLVISIDLAKQLLQVHRNTYALVLSMEILSLDGYWGNNRSMLMSNCASSGWAAARRCS
ncbi:hypothetical protein BDA96_05G183900 [Sorghum bicolor]|uniref:FAE domain-containing protein n=2 Tax=Sorghum bicolor TaxID=4558 RepID=A0A921UGX3_SORBI|nr:hypothetical protein BDA96_05G183900 [Sorghum bicolor]KXG28805.1 hypothetical protein SORBI_3005G169000 [Sorghum bicolor]